MKGSRATASKAAQPAGTSSPAPRTTRQHSTPPAAEAAGETEPSAAAPGDDMRDVGPRPSPPALRRSSRKPQAAPKPQAEKTPKPAAKRPRKKLKWDAERMLTDPKSPLAFANLRGLLSTSMAWDALDSSERQEVLSLFPDKSLVLGAGTEEARPDFAALMNDDTFRHDCATYVDNVAQGRFDPDWISSAWAAHERRKMGDFDEHLVSQFESTWGIDLPEWLKPKRTLAISNTDDAKSTPTKGKNYEASRHTGDQDTINHQAGDDGIQKNAAGSSGSPLNKRPTEPTADPPGSASMANGTDDGEPEGVSTGRKARESLVKRRKRGASMEAYGQDAADERP